MWGYYTIDQPKCGSTNGSLEDQYKRMDLEVQFDGQRDFNLPPPVVPNKAQLFVNGLKLTIGKDFTFSNSGVLTILSEFYPLEKTDQIEIRYL